VSAVNAAVTVGICVLISVAAFIPLVIVWREDHSWLDRPRF
jgi:hypothetical protein